MVTSRRTTVSIQSPKSIGTTAKTNNGKDDAVMTTEVKESLLEMDHEMEDMKEDENANNAGDEDIENPSLTKTTTKTTPSPIPGTIPPPAIKTTAKQTEPTSNTTTGKTGTTGTATTAAPATGISFADDLIQHGIKSPSDLTKCEEIVEYYDYGRSKDDTLEDARCPQTFKENRQKAKHQQDLQNKGPYQLFVHKLLHCCCLPFTTWSTQRWHLTLVGCTSSCIVLGIRLYLDMEPLAYFIHSIIVFLDMILIHIFTNCWWLSLCGEITTICCFIAFHFTKETVWELLETTLIAIFCSFQIIQSRSIEKHKNNQLQSDIKQLRRQTVLMMRRSTMHTTTSATHASTDHDNDDEDDDSMDNQLELAASATITALDIERFMEENEQQVAKDLNLTNDNDDNGSDSSDIEKQNHHESSLQSARKLMTDILLLHQDPEDVKEKAKICGEQFFEHFLDGSAGVMYTSFLGLIITELVRYGESSY